MNPERMNRERWMVREISRDQAWPGVAGLAVDPFLETGRLRRGRGPRNARRCDQKEEGQDEPGWAETTDATFTKFTRVGPR